MVCGQGGLLQEVAEALCAECCGRLRCGLLLLGVGGHGAAGEGRDEQVGVDAGQAFGCLPAHRVGDGGADVAAWAT